MACRVWIVGLTVSAGTVGTAACAGQIGVGASGRRDRAVFEGENRVRRVAGGGAIRSSRLRAGVVGASRWVGV